MKLKTRLLLLLGIMMLASLAGIAVLQTIHHAEEAEAHAYQRLRAESLLNQLIPLLEYPLDQFSRDYSQWDEMAGFVAKPDPDWARVNVDASLTTFRLTAAWVLTPDGTIVHAAKEPKVAALPRFPDPDGKLLEHARRRHFVAAYTRQGDTIYALRASPIQPSADLKRTSPPLGWLVALAEIDNDYLKRLGELQNTSVTLQPVAAPRQPTPHAIDKILLPLRDPSGNAISTLQLDFEPGKFTEDSNLHEMLLLAALALVLIATVLFVINLWVLRPFDLIAQSLVNGKPDALKPILANPTEIGHIARLVRIHFANQRAMSETMESRAQLARDLHDGVIQSIYAAGMGVAAAQSIIPSEPEAATKQLQQVRTLLNDTIREARSFITGLDAGSTDDQPFSTIVETLAESMCWIRKACTRIDIDDRAAQALPQQAREQSLQIIREALSNSLRHSQASEISVTLKTDSSSTTLSISDNGAGFDLSRRSATGHGLNNLTERALVIGSRAHVESEPGKGTCVKIVFAPSTAPFP